MEEGGLSLLGQHPCDHVKGCCSFEVLRWKMIGYGEGEVRDFGIIILFSGRVYEENNTTFLHIGQHPPVCCPFAEASQAVAELDLAYLLVAVDRLMWPNSYIICIQSNITTDTLFYDVFDED